MTPLDHAADASEKLAQLSGCVLPASRHRPLPAAMSRAEAGLPAAPPVLPPADAEKRCKEIVRRLRWKGPVFRISGATRAGTKELCQAIMRRLDELHIGYKDLATHQSSLEDIFVSLVHQGEAA